MDPLRLAELGLVEAFTDATRRAASAVAPHIGGGDKHAVDAVAVAALRAALGELAVGGRVVVGEGEKDEAPMLHLGELFGRGAAGDPLVDIAVDPVDGTRLAAEGLPGAMAVLAVAPRGALLDIGPAHYMEKLVAGVHAPGISLDAPLGENLERIAAASGVAVSALRVAVQDRPRNAGYVRAARAAGASVELFADGDVERCLAAASRGGGVDVVVGIGGAPEGVLTAAAVRALGGFMQGRLAPQSEAEAARVAAAGLAVDRIWQRDELCSAPGWLFLTAITDCAVRAGGPLPGVRTADGAVTVTSWVAGPGIRPTVVTATLPV